MYSMYIHVYVCIYILLLNRIDKVLGFRGLGCRYLCPFNADGMQFGGRARLSEHSRIRCRHVGLGGENFPVKKCMYDIFILLDFMSSRIHNRLPR